MKLVGMDECFVSDDQNSVIGTFALATCCGILLYDRKNKVGIVGHTNNNWIETVVSMFCSIPSGVEQIEYLVIPGYDRVISNDFEIKDKIEHFFEKMNSEKIKFIPFQSDKIIHLNEELEAYEFAFDVESGKFIDDKNTIESNIGGMSI